MNQQKLSIKDLELKNDKVTAETAKHCRVSETLVKEIINFTGAYSSDVMKQGAMESVMIPYFGKFRVKEKVLAYMKAMKQNMLNGKDTIWRAMNGKKIKGLIDETV